MSKILIEISRSALPHTSAELFYIAKACELMSAIIDMGTERLPHKTTDYEDMQRILHYIDQNYRSDIKQIDLVRLVNISPTKLKNLFRKFTGTSITEYILQKKADKALHMLADTDMPIEEIAKFLGFATVSGFSSSFKKRVGISPALYRKQIQFECMNNVLYFENLNQDYSQ